MKALFKIEWDDKKFKKFAYGKVEDHILALIRIADGKVTRLDYNTRRRLKNES